MKVYPVTLERMLERRAWFNESMGACITRDKVYLIDVSMSRLTKEAFECLDRQPAIEIYKEVSGTLLQVINGMMCTVV